MLHQLTSQQREKAYLLRWLPEAWERYQTLLPAQQEQTRRLIAALLLSPQAGRFWRCDQGNKPLFLVSAYDTPVVDRVLYYPTGDAAP